MCDKVEKLPKYLAAQKEHDSLMRELDAQRTGTGNVNSMIERLDQIMSTADRHTREYRAAQTERDFLMRCLSERLQDSAE
jgi:hypothetical protein